MDSCFTNNFFTQNRRTVRQQLPDGYPIVLSANGVIQRTADTSYPFQQESNFWYLTGIDEPDVVLVMTKTDEYLIVPHHTASKIIFDGAPDARALTDRSGIALVLSGKAGWERLHADVARTQHLHTILPAPRRDAHSGIFSNPAGRQCIERLRRRHSGIELHDISSLLATCRVQKQPEELLAIERAVNITCATLRDVRKPENFASYTHEYAIEAAVTHGFRSRGASGHAYGPIIASGRHATTLHYVANAGQIDSRDCIVVDVGAEVEHYAADITRTLMLTKPSPRQQAVLMAVRDVQVAALALLKPGTDMRSMERDVVLHMGKALQRLKLIDNPTDYAAIRRYYPHATSHFIGLDVHDVGDYSKPLEENMVLTCEPGIYIPEEGIGVRLEDDVLITATGHRNLSSDCSYEAYPL